MSRPLFIATADWHLRPDIPKCRTDDFLLTQKNKLDWISKLQAETNRPILNAGDIFNKHTCPLWFLIEIMQYLPEEMYAVIGNHDVPGHNLDRLYHTGLGVLDQSGYVEVLCEQNSNFSNFDILPVHWGQPLPKADLVMDLRDRGRIVVVLAHIMTYYGTAPWPGCTDLDAVELIEQCPANYIITGHNHQTFHVKHNNSVLINPGSLTRQTADQKDFVPSVYLVYNDKFKKITIPHEKDVITREHIDRQLQKDERYDAFIVRAGQDMEVELSFRRNIEAFMRAKRIKKPIMEIIRSSLP